MSNMRGGNVTTGFAGSGGDVMTKRGSDATIVQTFGKQTRGEDMHGPMPAAQKDAMPGGGIHNLRHSITESGNVTGVPTSSAPHSTRKAV